VCVETDKKMEYNESLSVKIDDANTINNIINLFHPTPQYRLMLDAFYAETIDKLKVQDVCQNCRTRFSQWSNIGLRGCRTHPGRYAESIWECCYTMTSLAQYDALSLHRQSNTSMIYRYETPGKISGCVAADHFTMADQRVITEEQYEAITKIQNEYQHDQTTATRFDQLLIPKRLTTTARIEIPLLVFILLPNASKRKISHLVCKVPFSLNQYQVARQDMSSIFNVSVTSSGAHPFEGTEMEKATITLDSDSSYNLADIYVYVTRMNTIPGYFG